MKMAPILTLAAALAICAGPCPTRADSTADLERAVIAFVLNGTVQPNFANLLANADPRVQARILTYLNKMAILDPATRPSTPSERQSADRAERLSSALPSCMIGDCADLNKLLGSPGGTQTSSGDSGTSGPGDPGPGNQVSAGGDGGNAGGGQGASNAGAGNAGAGNPGGSNSGAGNPGGSNAGGDQGASNPGASNPGAANPTAPTTSANNNPPNANNTNAGGGNAGGDQGASNPGAANPTAPATSANNNPPNANNTNAGAGNPGRSNAGGDQGASNAGAANPTAPVTSANNNPPNANNTNAGAGNPPASGPTAALLSGAGLDPNSPAAALLAAAGLVPGNVGAGNAGAGNPGGGPGASNPGAGNPGGGQQAGDPGQTGAAQICPPAVRAQWVQRIAAAQADLDKADDALTAAQNSLIDNFGKSNLGTAANTFKYKALEVVRDSAAASFQNVTDQALKCFNLPSELPPAASTTATAAPTSKPPATPAALKPSCTQQAKACAAAQASYATAAKMIFNWNDAYNLPLPCVAEYSPALQNNPLATPQEQQALNQWTNARDAYLTCTKTPTPPAAQTTSAGGACTPACGYSRTGGWNPNNPVAVNGSPTSMVWNPANQTLVTPAGQYDSCAQFMCKAGASAKPGTPNYYAPNNSAYTCNADDTSLLFATYSVSLCGASSPASAQPAAAKPGAVCQAVCTWSDGSDGTTGFYQADGTFVYNGCEPVLCSSMGWTCYPGADPHFSKDLCSRAGLSANGTCAPGYKTIYFTGVKIMQTNSATGTVAIVDPTSSAAAQCNKIDGLGPSPAAPTASASPAPSSPISALSSPYVQPLTAVAAPAPNLPAGPAFTLAPASQPNVSRPAQPNPCNPTAAPSVTTAKAASPNSQPSASTPASNNGASSGGGISLKPLASPSLPATTNGGSSGGGITLKPIPAPPSLSATTNGASSGGGISLKPNLAPPSLSATTNGGSSGGGISLKPNLAAPSLSATTNGGSSSVPNPCHPTTAATGTPSQQNSNKASAQPASNSTGTGQHTSSLTPSGQHVSGSQTATRRTSSYGRSVGGRNQSGATARSTFRPAQTTQSRGGGFGGGGFGGHRSDIRLKEDIVPLGRLGNGIGLYRFRYKGADHTVYVGVMAQEVQNIVPRAVSRDRDGFLRVDYDRIGVEFMTWDDYLAGNSQ